MVDPMRPSLAGPVFDHLVVAGPDLAALCEWWADHAGAAPTPGGAHTGLGTRNALVGLGPTSYLELVGPDPDQSDHAGPRPFGINQLDEIRLVTWAVAVDDLERAVADAHGAGIDPGPIIDMERARPDGVRLVWRLAVPPASTLAGVVPFLIEWGNTPHPAADLDPVGRVTTVDARHPEAAGLDPFVRSVTGVGVAAASAPSLAATVDLGGRTLELG